METKLAGRAAMLGAVLGAWLGLLTGAALGLAVAALNLLLMAVAGLLAGSAAGAVIGLVTHVALDARVGETEQAAQGHSPSRTCRPAGALRHGRGSRRPRNRPAPTVSRPGPSARSAHRRGGVRERSR